MRRVALLALILCGGCGYQSGSMMPDGLTDIAVEVFGNETKVETFYRNAEVTYTRFLTRELVRKGHVRIRDPEQAQAVIRGKLIRMDRVTLVRDSNDKILEDTLVAAVHVEVVDPRTGLPIMEPFVITRRRPRVVPRGDTMEETVDKTMTQLAQDTFIRIQAESFFRTRARQAPR